MCKFHILGCCSRGSACHFAHTKEELTSQPDLARTKLCKTLISTGQCTDPECRYAHSKEELRLVLGFNCSNAPAFHAAPVTDSHPAPSAQGQAGAAPAGGASGPAGQESSSLQQPGTALQQAAMQQLAEAAQAHAAEAMRLQAMAACLQAQGAGLPAQFAGVPFVAAAQGCGGFPGMAVPATPPQALAAGAHTGATGPAPGRSQRGRGDRGPRGKGGRGGGGQQQAQGKGDANAGHFPRAGNGNMFRAQVPSAAEREPMPSPAGPYPLMGGGLLSQSLPDGGGAPGCYFGQMAQGTEPDAGMVSSLPSEDNFTPREPVQINPLSMRSLSNCSLVDLAAKAEAEGQGATPPGQQLQSGQGTSALGWTVKNTFLDFEATSPAPGRLRPICSAAGRLNALAEGSTPTSPELGPHEDPYLEAARGHGRQVQQLSPAPEEPALAQQPALLAEKRAQDTPLALGQAPPRAAAATASPQWPAGQLAGHAAGGCGGGAQRTGGGFASTVTAGGTEDARNGAVTEAGDHQQEQSESSSSPTGAVAGETGPCGGGSTAPAPSPGLGAPLLVEGITVKNTFLDFAPPEPAAALRAVQTAAGRLDLLGHEDDDED